MSNRDIDGPRIGELLLAELVGRKRGAFENVSVDGIDDPRTFSCAVGDRYEIMYGGNPRATVEITASAVTLRYASGETETLTDGPAVKAVLDRLIQPE